MSTFVDVMDQLGLVEKRLRLDGHVHRCTTKDKPHKLNGVYYCDGDWGWVINHATMTEAQLWFSKRPSTPAQQRVASQKIEAFRVQQKQARERAIKTMRAYWQALPTLWGGHPYLDHKQLTMHGCAGLKQDGELLIVPMYRQGQLMSLQTIAPDGHKKYRWLCPVRGSSLTLTPKRSVMTAFVEGLATGLAVYQHVPHCTVVVCFDAGNMRVVAQEYKASGMTVVCADNDWTKEVNTGLLAGQAVAQTLKCGLAYPQGIQGSDWADALLEWGESAPFKIKSQIMANAKLVI
jgi:putative DNA primase/helicase